MKGKKLAIGIIGLLAIGIMMMAATAADEERGVQNEQAIEQTNGARAEGVFEDLVELGFDPKTQDLTATMSIKTTGGFGAFEYVTFWIDFNNNAVFETNEVVGISNVFVPNPGVGALLPLRYTTSVKVDRPPTVGAGSIRRARAVLSFSVPTLALSADPAKNVVRNIRLDPP